MVSDRNQHDSQIQQILSQINSEKSGLQHSQKVVSKLAPKIEHLRSIEQKLSDENKQLLSRNNQLAQELCLLSSEHNLKTKQLALVVQENKKFVTEGKTVEQIMSQERSKIPAMKMQIRTCHGQQEAAQREYQKQQRKLAQSLQELEPIRQLVNEAQQEAEQEGQLRSKLQHEEANWREDILKLQQEYDAQRNVSNVQTDENRTARAAFGEQNQREASLQEEMDGMVNMCKKLEKQICFLEADLEYERAFGLKTENKLTELKQQGTLEREKSEQIEKKLQTIANEKVQLSRKLDKLKFQFKFRVVE